MDNFQVRKLLNYQRVTPPPQATNCLFSWTKIVIGAVSKPSCLRPLFMSFFQHEFKAPKVTSSTILGLVFVTISRVKWPQTKGERGHNLNGWEIPWDPWPLGVFRFVKLPFFIRQIEYVCPDFTENTFWNHLISVFSIPQISVTTVLNTKCWF